MLGCKLCMKKQSWSNLQSCLHICWSDLIRATKHHSCDISIRSSHVIDQQISVTDETQGLCSSGTFGPLEGEIAILSQNVRYHSLGDVGPHSRKVETSSTPLQMKSFYFDIILCIVK